MVTKVKNCGLFGRVSVLYEASGSIRLPIIIKPQPIIRTNNPKGIYSSQWNLRPFCLGLLLPNEEEHERTRGIQGVQMELKITSHNFPQKTRVVFLHGKFLRCTCSSIPGKWVSLSEFCEPIGTSDLLIGFIQTLTFATLFSTLKVPL